MKLKTSIFVVVFLVVLAVTGGDCWGRRRRRRAPVVDCDVGDWGKWGKCISDKCGTGKQTRTRLVTRNPANGGKACPSLKQTRSCFYENCPIDCEWGPWGKWSECSSCGDAGRSRVRIAETLAMFGGDKCSGSHVQTDPFCDNPVACEHQTWTCPKKFKKCSIGPQRCIAKSLQCNGDFDCDDGSDEMGKNCADPPVPCGRQLSVLPNINLLGSGYNIVTNRNRGTILDNTKYNGTCDVIESYDHAKSFRKPFDVQSLRFMTSATTGLTVEQYKGAKEFYEDRTKSFEFVVSTGTGFSAGLFSAGAKVTATLDDTVRTIAYASSEEASTYFRVYSDINIAEFTNARSKIIFNRNFLNRVNELPVVYDASMYEKMITDFGTHYYISGRLGGRYEYVLRYSSEDIRVSQLTDEQQSKCIETEVKAGIGPFKGTVSNKVCWENSLSQSAAGNFTTSASETFGLVKGGSSAQAAALSSDIENALDPEKYNKWAETVKQMPVLLEAKLAFMSSLIDDADKRKNMEQALLAYFQKFDSDLKCGTECSNDGKPIVTNDGLECTCLCKFPFYGKSCTFTDE